MELSRLPEPGSGKLYVAASDGVRSSRAEVTSIEVPARPPTAHILSPVPDSHLPFGEPVSVLGCCLDMAGQPCPPDLISWLLDGDQFAAGRVVAVLEHASPGAHRLTLEYGDGRDRIASSVDLEIDEPDPAYRHWQALVGVGEAPTTRWVPKGTSEGSGEQTPD